MGANRIELIGFTDAMRERLSAYGLFHEIISWKLRMFVPTDAAGIDVLANCSTAIRSPASATVQPDHAGICERTRAPPRA